MTNLEKYAPQIAQMIADSDGEVCEYFSDGEYCDSCPLQDICNSKKKLLGHFHKEAEE